MPKEKYCVIKGIAGLGNRLITLERGIQYAQSTGRKLYVDWRDGMNGPRGANVFYQYFKLNSVDHITDPSEIVERLSRGGQIYPPLFGMPNFNAPLHDTYRYVPPSLIKNSKAKYLLSLFFPHKMGTLVGSDYWTPKDAPTTTSGYKRTIKSYRSANDFPLGAALSKRLKEDVVVFADFQPICVWNNLRNHIALNNAYQDKIRKFALENRLSQAIGIHVRHTDKKSPVRLSKLMERLNVLVGSKPDTRLFVSTDNVDIEETFRRRFGDKLIVYPKNTPSTSGKGIHHWARCCKDEDLKREIFEGGLADMWLLSMTKYLFRQGNSSFSKISSWLRSDTSRVFDWLKL